jgi:hypothetical protein
VECRQRWDRLVSAFTLPVACVAEWLWLAALFASGWAAARWFLLERKHQNKLVNNATRLSAPKTRGAHDTGLIALEF